MNTSYILYILSVVSAHFSRVFTSGDSILHVFGKSKRSKHQARGYFTSSFYISAQTFQDLFKESAIRGSFSCKVRNQGRPNGWLMT